MKRVKNAYVMYPFNRLSNIGEQFLAFRLSFIVDDDDYGWWNNGIFGYRNIFASYSTDKDDEEKDEHDDEEYVLEPKIPFLKT